MTKLLGIIHLNLLLTFKDKRTLVFLIAFPLIFTFIFGKAFGDGGEAKIPIVIVDQDNTSISRELIKDIKAIKSVGVTIAKNRNEGIELVKNKDSELTFIIDKGLAKGLRENYQAQVETVTLPNSNSAMAIKEILMGIVNRMEADALAAKESVTLQGQVRKMNSQETDELWIKVFNKAKKKWSPEPPMTVKYQELSGKDITKTDYNSITHYSLGFSVAFVMFTLTFGAGHILEEKEKGTWGRMLTTPTRPSLILAGNLIGTFIIGWIQVAILILAGQFMFHVDWGSNLFGVIIIMSTYLFAITGFGLMLTGFVRTHAQLQAMTQVILPAFAMLGGAYWPLDMVPKSMQLLGKFVPTGQAMNALLDVVARGKELSAVQQPIYILLLMGVIFFAVGLNRVKIN